MKKPAPPLERVVQKQVVVYLKAHGWAVWQTSQGHKHPTGAKGLRITPGIPDLYAIHREHGALWIEVKRETGVLSAAQRRFAEWHAYTRLGLGAVPAVFCVRSLNDLITQLAEVYG